MKRFLFFLAFVSLIFVSCTSSKGLVKKAKKLESTHQYQAASELYFLAVKKKSTNIDALSGMERTGRLVLDDKLKSFSEAKLNEDYKTATYAYLDAVKYQKRIQSINIKLPISNYQKEDFEIVQDKYLNQEYQLGLDLIEHEQFSKAEQKFNEIFKFNKDFKNVRELRNIAYLEPYYRKAEQFKNEKEYRKAYYAYQKILARVDDYKDTKKNCDYVLKKGRINIVLLDKKRKNKFQFYTENIKSYTESAIIDKKDPFIKLVDRENMESVLKEQDLSISGLVSEGSSLELGNLTGAQYALSIEVSNFTFHEKAVTPTKQQGYEKYVEKIYDKTTETTEYKTKYKPVVYYTYAGYRQVTLNVHYKLLSLKTGEIINSKVVEDRQTSEIYYVAYNGNVTKLYPRTNDKVNTSYTANQELVKLSQERKTLIPKNQLTTELYKRVSQEITNLIIDEFSK